YMADGQRSTYSDTGPTGTAPLDPVVLPELALVVQQLDSMANSVPVDAPWNASSAADWDGQTLETWVKNNSASPTFQRLVQLAGRIDYHPILPPERDQLTQRYGQGTLTKVAAVYDKPFWRDQGLTGQAVSIDGLVSATFDDSPPDGGVGGVGVLFGFVGGDSARAYQRMSPQEGRDKVI